MKPKTFRRYWILFVWLLLGFCTVYGQNDTIVGKNYIEKLISEKKIAEANTALYERIEILKTKKNYDSLVDYIILTGSFSLSEGDIKLAFEKAEELVTHIKKSGDPSVIAKALTQLSNIYFTARQQDKVKTVSEEALSYAIKAKPFDSISVAIIHYNLGTAMLNLGNINASKEHLYESKNLLENKSGKHLIDLYNAYNSIGRFHSSITQLDSSTFYYKKALSQLKKMDSTEVNRDYWKAIVNNNISLNLQNTGNTSLAIAYIKNAISDYKNFIEKATDETKKLRAQRFRLMTIDNLGTFYHGIGEYNRAVEIMTYSYKQKLKLLNEDDPNIVFSLAILGHANLSAKNYDLAGLYIEKALEQINRNPENYSYLHGYVLSLSASIYEAEDKLTQAQLMYEACEKFYQKNFDGTFSKDYLDIVINMSLFYAKTGNAQKAIDLAETGYNYTKRDEFENDLIHFYHIQNLADVNFELKNYSKAKTYSNEALSYFSDKAPDSKTLSDSIQIDFIKPRALLVNAKSKYQLQNEKNEAFLKQLLSQVEKGIAILERRKILVKTPEDLNILIGDNNDLFSFAKQLRLDLYEKTHKETYLMDLITIHESSIYNRIRTRLNIRNNIAFSNIPTEVIDREKKLKENISSSFQTSKNENIHLFFEASTIWESFLDSLKQKYPKYYKMRYGKIEEPLENLQQKIPDNTTIVRYLFIEENLFAFVVSSSEKNLFKLDFTEVKNLIPELIDNDFKAAKLSPKLVNLYQNLWQPFAEKIRTENVIIIPDKDLFNLSFEMLVTSPISSYKDLAKNSLLAKYNISYNFSLLLQNNQKSTFNNYSENFIAFAPEFSEKMKENYKLAITDSIALDKSYLTLLSQPFSVDLVKEYSKIFNGNSFINEKASKEIFESKAGEHKIIHIGTHAESNNVSPELSRLIFAKNIADENRDDNFLYTYEIYNYNLSADLAILTACETGKPTYQAGEGMISLAHAFTYAGSESILTSLWKIDEKSSADIIGNFYDNIAEGMPKDKALRQAKLKYLSTADGRTLAPQYWAGLVLMGDTSPIDLNTGTPFWYWVAGVIVFLFFMVVIIKNRKKLT